MNKFIDFLKQNPAVAKALGVAMVFAVGVGVGRYSLPARVVTKVEVKEVDKSVTDKTKTKDTDKVVTIVERTNPDGTKVKETRIEDKSKIASASQERKDVTKESSSETTTEYELGWHFRLMTGVPLSTSAASLRWGVGLDKRVLGPLTVGAFGFLGDAPMVGVSLGIGL